MKIVALTDIHSNLDFIYGASDVLRAADLVLLPGDLTMFGRRDAVMQVVDAVRRHNMKILAVMGNCDCREVEEYLTEEGMCLHRAHTEIDGIAFVGLGGSLHCPVPTLNEWTEEETAEHLRAAVDGLVDGTPMVLVSHQPPKDTAVDIAGNGMHVGSTAVREFIEAHQPVVCFSGHIHEAQGTDAIGNTKLINPGPFLEGKYAWVEFEGGTCRVEARRLPDPA